MNSLFCDAEQNNISQSQAPITSPGQHDRSRSLLSDNENPEILMPHRSLLATPSPARSSCSSSSNRSSPSYNTPITSPEPSPSGCVLDSTEKKPDAFFAQSPPTPTPSHRVRRQSSRSTSANFKPPLKSGRPTAKGKAKQTSLENFLFDEKNCYDGNSLTSTLLERSRPLGDPSLIDSDITEQGAHDSAEKKINKARERSQEEPGTSSVAGEDHLPTNFSQLEKDNHHNCVAEKGGTIPETPAEPQIHLLMPGSFPEEPFLSASTARKERPTPLLPTQTIIASASILGSTDVSQEVANRYPRFERRYSQRSQHSVHQKVSTQLQKPLTKSSSMGYIYIFKQDSEHTSHIKIGRTTKDPDTRTKQQEKCYLGEVLTMWEHPLPVAYHERVERLVQMELVNLNYTFKCGKCKRKDKHGPSTHQEWFLLEWEPASILIGRWNNWMNSRDPYDHNGDLKPFWCERLHTYKRANSADPYKPRDMSKTVWKLEETALYWDHWANPMAIEIWWFRLRQSLSFFWSFLMLCKRALCDPANSRTALSFLALMTMCSFTLPVAQSLYLGAVFWMLILLPYLHQRSFESQGSREKKRLTRSNV